VERARLAEERRLRWEVTQRRRAVLADPAATSFPVCTFDKGIIDCELIGLQEPASAITGIRDGVLRARVRNEHPHPRPILWVHATPAMRRFTRAVLRVRVVSATDGAATVRSRFVVRHNRRWEGEDLHVDLQADGQWHEIVLRPGESPSWGKMQDEGRVGFRFPEIPGSPADAEIVFEIDRIVLETDA
jgi:hypothetical protein